MDREKIYETFLSLARIGEEEDGAVSRLLFGEAYMEAVRQTEKYMKTAGLETWVDPCGNLHGFFPAESREAGPSIWDHTLIQ